MKAMKMAESLSKYIDKKQRSLVTPEGVDLGLRIADSGARIGAFIIDLMIIIISLVIIAYGLDHLSISLGRKNNEIVFVVWILVFFFLRNFYFMFFEMGNRAATPGKRIMKIRVANRKGGYLSAGSVFARNAMRELEFFLPLGFFFAKKTGVEGWMTLFGLIWGLVFLLFPLFNKDRLRAGDLLAGSWVVHVPKPILSKDLADASLASAEYKFTQKQINAYGVKELHVLENIIRKKHKNTIAEVAQRIRKKIDWPEPDNTGKSKFDIYVEDMKFLKAYYAALRGKLESKLLFGVRRKDKFDKR